MDLNPTGAIDSEALTVSNGMQVGDSTYTTSTREGSSAHAGYWLGTADSWVDLAPSWADDSWAEALYTLDGVTYIVGSANYDDQAYTLVWTDAAVSGGAWQGLNGPGPGGSAVPAPAAGLTFLAAAVLKRRRRRSTCG